MVNLMRRHFRLVALVQTLMLIACAAPPGSTAAPAAAVVPASSAQTLEALRATIGGAPCSSDAQCHSVGVGARPCGGPESYLSWSDQTADPLRVAQLAARYAQARRAENEGTGIVGDCRFKPDPGAVCTPRTPAGPAVCQPGAAGRSNAR